MTMIPPKIKGLPNLRKVQTGYIKNTQKGSSYSNRSLYAGGSKMVR